jgi:dTDP-4-amino-4,6-dideoxygalactose transaminase
MLIPILAGECDYDPYGRQDIKQADIDAVLDVLKSDFITQEPMVPLFEKNVSEIVGAKYAVAVNSATSALHIACLALGMGEVGWLMDIAKHFCRLSKLWLY